MEIVKENRLQWRMVHYSIITDNVLWICTGFDDSDDDIHLKNNARSVIM